MSHAPLTDLQDPEESGDLFDYKAIRQWVGFVWHSVGRHKVAAAVGFLSVVSLSLFLAWVMPNKYAAQVKLLANRGDLMAQLGNPHRSNSMDSDGPTRAAAETVMSRDALVSTVKQTNLLEHWANHRHPVLKFKDMVVEKIGGPQTEDQKVDGMIGTLEKRLQVTTTDGTVIISVEWPDATMARQLVETAQQNFLEARHVSEVSAISEAISILELHTTEAQTSIDDAVANVQKVAEDRKKEKRPAAPIPIAAPRPAPRPAAAPSDSGASTQELAQLKFLIRTKRRSISDLEEYRNRRLTDLQAKLAEQRVIYSAGHPVIIDIQQQIDSLQRESPQIEALKRDEQSLIDEYKVRAGGRDPDAAEIGPSRSSSGGGASASVRAGVDTTDEVLKEINPDLREDPNVLVARDQLRMAISRYQDLLMRVDAAHIELDTSRAAFKYRYSVISPAQTPRKPIGPNKPLIVLAGILGGLFFAFFTGTAMDLSRGKMVEPWQVEQLNVPLLASVKI